MREVTNALGPRQIGRVSIERGGACFCGRQYLLNIVVDSKMITIPIRTFQRMFQRQRSVSRSFVRQMRRALSRAGVNLDHDEELEALLVHWIDAIHQVGEEEAEEYKMKRMDVSIKALNQFVGMVKGNKTREIMEREKVQGYRYDHGFEGYVRGKSNFDCGICNHIMICLEELDHLLIHLYDLLSLEDPLRDKVDGCMRSLWDKIAVFRIKVKEYQHLLPVDCLDILEKFMQRKQEAIETLQALDKHQKELKSQQKCLREQRNLERGRVKDYEKKLPHNDVLSKQEIREQLRQKENKEVLESYLPLILENNVRALEKKFSDDKSLGMGGIVQIFELIEERLAKILGEIKAQVCVLVEKMSSEIQEVYQKVTGFEVGTQYRIEHEMEHQLKEDSDSVSSSIDNVYDYLYKTMLQPVESEIIDLETQLHVLEQKVPLIQQRIREASNKKKKKLEKKSLKDVEKKIAEMKRTIKQKNNALKVKEDYVQKQMQQYQESPHFIHDENVKRESRNRVERESSAKKEFDEKSDSIKKEFKPKLNQSEKELISLESLEKKLEDSVVGKVVHSQRRFEEVTDQLLKIQDEIDQLEEGSHKIIDQTCGSEKENILEKGRPDAYIGTLQLLGENPEV